MTLTQNLGPKNRGVLAILEASGFQKIAEVKILRPILSLIYIQLF